MLYRLPQTASSKRYLHTGDYCTVCLYILHWLTFETALCEWTAWCISSKSIKWIESKLLCNYLFFCPFFALSLSFIHVDIQIAQVRTFLFLGQKCATCCVFLNCIAFRQDECNWSSNKLCIKSKKKGQMQFRSFSHSIN